ncbi:hypothetical protein [Mycobacterium intracellulare]|uniref:hypothetical protein n=1 Tax=Mycobacterium intracellulare TaxID=1767 RepID=UPI000CE307C8|nr:hypothetical protein [Mycobacterium intracellulare]
MGDWPDSLPVDVPCPYCEATIDMSGDLDEFTERATAPIRALLTKGPLGNVIAVVPPVLFARFVQHLSAAHPEMGLDALKESAAG